MLWLTSGAIHSLVVPVRRVDGCGKALWLGERLRWLRLVVFCLFYTASVIEDHTVYVVVGLLGMMEWGNDHF